MVALYTLRTGSFFPSLSLSILHRHCLLSPSPTSLFSSASSSTALFPRPPLSSPMSSFTARVSHFLGEIETLSSGYWISSVLHVYTVTALSLYQ
ncbi:hypothetical protein JHK82_034111 [Glycine max]|uniref:Uncharacterized protein n=1 Tax=Glycine max TaxID=3847 RepID=K7LVA8_SOYBN|nr:hypothetical protein JHK87_034040 [Glycine soja]KAG4980865.1 hypothetical protein JHK85_034823 [Glycine max]KAG4986489.1 hypothetical protein JHK86_034180 [Glycine max]KAG5119691.1 hypothetical protein JHK82_034111 [Glycine max]KAG5140681.1 hypothetical protein JHK84_034449 [Glycine max]